MYHDLTLIIVNMLKEHGHHDLKEGYVAIHDRAGQVLGKVELNEHLYDDQHQDDDHGPAEGEVVMGGADDSIYDEVDSDEHGVSPISVEDHVGDPKPIGDDEPE